MVKIEQDLATLLTTLERSPFMTQSVYILSSSAKVCLMQLTVKTGGWTLISKIAHKINLDV